MREFAGDTIDAGTIGTAVPTGNVGIDMTAFNGTTRAKAWLVTIIVAVATTDITVYGALAQGNIDDSTDDIWGTHQDRHGAYPDGKLGSALAIGTHHRIIDDLGIYSRVAFVASSGAASVTIKLTEILEAGRRT